MISWYSAVLALLMLVIAWVLGKKLKETRKNTQKYTEMKVTNLQKIKSTEKLEVGKYDLACDICFGELDEGSVYQCECGKIFDTECAEMTGECPYCSADITHMKARPINKPKCPSCGKLLIDNICSCGTVLPNADRTFKCACGKKILLDESECKYCGAKYEPSYKDN